LAAALCFALPSEGAVRVGAASVKITPPTGAPMAGYYYERAAEGTHDELLANTIVLEVDGKLAALVSLDLISTQRRFVEAARAEVSRTLGIPADHVMISATHAHTGPIFASTSARFDSQGGSNPIAVSYTEQLPKWIVESVSLAKERLAPVTISAAKGVAEGLAFNRRFHMKDGTVGWNAGKLNPNIIRPAGPVDPEVPLVVFEDAQKRPLAAYVNFAMHLDTVGGMKFSADYPFALREALKAAKDTNLVTLFTIGCAGDVNHINVSHGHRQQGHGEAARIGTILAASALRAWDELAPLTNLSLRARAEVVALPLAKITEQEVSEARAVLARMNAPEKPKFLEQVKAFQTLEVQGRQGQPLEAEVQVITLGKELAWVSLPGEIFVELGLTIKRGSPFKHTIIAELANGSVGYVPNRVAYPQGNYEVISARCAEGSGELLVDAALRMLREEFTNK
ncbi:MAG TPA: hypothetical protein VEH27_20385, partial [Methylomirabilota bacterium]|nr:hypothetical protein [Methylomirabilota bacterium]